MPPKAATGQQETSSGLLDLMEKIRTRTSSADAKLLGFAALAFMLTLLTPNLALAQNGLAVEPLPDPPILDLMEVQPFPDVTFNNDPAWPARLAALFEETVLHDESKRPRGINKWTGPIELSLHGDAADAFAGFVETIAAELSTLINQPIKLHVDQESAGDIDIYITYWKNYWPFFLQSKETGRRIFTCAVLPRVHRGQIKRASIKINAGVIAPATARACLLEELTQALGLFGETEIETETLLHDGIGYEGLGAIDRLLIRALYDPRLKIGMSNERAAPLAATILNELLKEQLAPE